MKALSSHPLAANQRDIWLAQARFPHAPLFNIAGWFDIGVGLDEALLRQSLQWLIDHTDAMRLTADWRTSAPGQTLFDSLPAELIVERFGADQREQAVDWLQRMLATPFPLDGSPLFRYAIARVGNERTLGVTIFHHLIMDGWSIALVFRRLCAIHAQFAAGKTPVEEDYGAFLEILGRESAYRASDAAKRDETFWRDQFRRLPEPLFGPRSRPDSATRSGLPCADPRAVLADPRSGAPTFHAEEAAAPVSRTVVLRLAPERYERLKSFCRSMDATPFHLILAVVYLYLFNSGRRGEFVVGLPTRNRSGQRLRQTAGMMIGVIPVWLHPQPNWPIRRILAEIQQTLRRVYRHQRRSLGAISRASALPATGERALFDVMVSFEQWDLTGAFHGVPAKTGQFFNNASPHPLALTVCEFHPARYADLHFECQERFFSPEEMAGLPERFDALLEAVMAHPERRADGFGLPGAVDAPPTRGAPTGETPTGKTPTSEAPTSEATTGQATTGQATTGQATTGQATTGQATTGQATTGQATTGETGYFGPAADDPEPPSVIAAFAQQVRRAPEAVAIRHDGGALSYGALNDAVNRLANHLRAAGLKAETPVGLCLERSVEMVIALLGVMRAGGAILPLDPEHPAARSRALLERAKAPLLIASREAAEPLAEFTGLTLTMDPDAPWRGASARAPEGQIAPDRLAYIIHTSGSTGHPKGVMVAHRALALRLGWMARAFAVTERDRILQGFRLVFDPSLHEILLPLISGATLVLAPPGRIAPERLAQTIQSHAVTIASFVPALLDGFLAAPAAASCHTLRLVTSGGEAASTSLLQRFRRRFSCRFLNLYGPTEATILATAWEGEAAPPGPWLPLGAPIEQTAIHLLDPHGQPAAPGAEGEIHIGGPALARGYLGLPEETHKRFVADPFSGAKGARLYRTGDRGRWLAPGGLHFLGRVDRQIKIRGHRVEPGEVEAALAQCPGVQQAAVEGWPLPSGGKGLAACVTGLADDAANRERLLGHLAGMLPDHMLPFHVSLLESLPLTENGKIDYRALPQPDFRRGAHAPPAQAPRTALQRRLAELWARSLDCGPLGIEENFFEIGGDSLAALAILASVEEELGVALPASAIFQYPTIARLAEAIERRDSAAEEEPRPPRLAPLLIEINGGGARPPFFCIASGHGDRGRLGALAHLIGADQPFFLLEPPEAASEATPGEAPMQELAERYAALIAARADKPFRLGGFSIGGVLALETADRLRRRGVDPGPPILLDTIFPRALPLALALYRLLGEGVRRLGWQRRSLAGRSLRARFLDAGLAWQLQAAALWRAPCYSFPAVIIRSQALTRFSWLLFSPWRRRLPKGINLFTVPGGHGGMFQPPRRAHLAALLRWLIDASPDQDPPAAFDHRRMTRHETAQAGRSGGQVGQEGDGGDDDAR